MMGKNPIHIMVTGIDIDQIIAINHPGGSCCDWKPGVFLAIDSIQNSIFTNLPAELHNSGLVGIDPEQNECKSLNR